MHSNKGMNKNAYVDEGYQLAQEIKKTSKSSVFPTH